jgi:hypothetical protein
METSVDRAAGSSRSVSPTLWISYESSDRTAAREIASLLRAHSLEVATPDDVSPGSEAFSQIASGLDRADLVIALLGESTAGNATVDAEIAYALSEGKPILPVRLSKHAHLPLLLSSIQTFDMFGAPLATLVSALATVVRSRSSVGSPYLRGDDKAGAFLAAGKKYLEVSEMLRQELESSVVAMANRRSINATVLSVAALALGGGFLFFLRRVQPGTGTPREAVLLLCGLVVGVVASFLTRRLSAHLLSSTTDVIDNLLRERPDASSPYLGRRSGPSNLQ